MFGLSNLIKILSGKWRNTLWKYELKMKLTIMANSLICIAIYLTKTLR